MKAEKKVTIGTIVMLFGLAQFILLLALGVWLGTSEHTAIALVVFGILFVGLIVFEIRITILEKKM